MVRYDETALPLRQFSVASDQNLVARAWSRPTGSTSLTASALPVPAFPLVDGFVELSGKGSLTVDTSTTVRLRDSNGRGGVTSEDLQFGSSEDLFTVATPPNADAVLADIALTTDLLATASGRMVVASRAPLSTTPYGTVTITRDAALDRLSSLTRPQAFAAFAQFASAVVAAEEVVDADLPLLQARLTDLYSPGDRLLELVTRQATARIVCGAAPSSPPSGAARPGQVRYCQALTDGQVPDAGSVKWSAADGATTADGGDSSVGTAPTSHVRVSGGGGFPRLTVKFTVGGAPRTASTLLTSVQDLGRVLREEGFSVTPSYDPVAQAFELPISQSLARRNVVVPTGGATSLTPLTGLTGLCPADPATADDAPRRCARPSDAAPDTTGTLDVGPSSFTGTLGIALPAAGTAATPAVAAVAYIKPGTDGELWRVADVKANVKTAKLSGRIGFLAVDVDVTGYTLTTTGDAARITLPVRSLDLPSGAVKSGVTPLNDLLGVGGNAPVVAATGSRGLTAAAALAVRDGFDSTGARPLNKSGTVDATYPDLSDGVLPQVTTDDRLRRPAPARPAALDPRRRRHRQPNRRSRRLGRRGHRLRPRLRHRPRCDAHSGGPFAADRQAQPLRPRRRRPRRVQRVHGALEHVAEVRHGPALSRPRLGRRRRQLRARTPVRHRRGADRAARRAARPARRGARRLRDARPRCSGWIARCRCSTCVPRRSTPPASRWAMPSGP